MPKVSICIPAYEQVELLKKTLDSIIIQSFSDYEIIITDDSRSDKVENLVNRYKHNSSLKYFRNTQQLGSPRNWNEAISKASGEYIKILHHDDWFHDENSLKTFITLLDENPQADFAFSASHVVLENGKRWVHSMKKECINIIRKYPNKLFDMNLVGGPSATIFRNHNYLFDINLIWLVDIEFYIRLLKINNLFVYHEQPLVVTFAAKGRISDYCAGKKEVEVFEYFFTFQTIANQTPSLPLSAFKSNILTLVSICEKHSIKSISDVRKYKYAGKIHKILRLYFFLLTYLPFSKRLFMKVLRRF